MSADARRRVGPRHGRRRAAGLWMAFLWLACGRLPAAAGDTATAPAAPGWWSRVAADLESREYHATPAGGGLQAPNRAQGFRARFTDSGIELVPRVPGGPAWVWRWRTAGHGRDGRVAAAPADAPRADGARVAYAGGALGEWCENGPRGLVHGFAVASPPPGGGALVIRGGVAGLRAAERAGGGVGLADERGAEVLRYGVPTARDAAGRALPARLAAEGAALAIRVDDRGAAYPITVESVITAAAWQRIGDQAGAMLGAAVATAGDVDGDGFSDVVVGAPLYDLGGVDAGAVFVFLGARPGLAASPAWSFGGGQAGAQFGASVAAAGDVDLDGYGDLLVGAPLHDNGQTDEGRAYLFRGKADAQLVLAWTAESDQAGARFGVSVAGAGDVNRDRHRDVIVGAHLYRDDPHFPAAGRAYLYLGSPAGLAPAPAWTRDGDRRDLHLGWSVAPAGDVDRDGYADVVVGAPGIHAPGMRGRAEVFLGGPGGLAAAPARTLEGARDSSRFGASVSTAGDVDGDGFSDVIVGAPDDRQGFPGEGCAYLHLGSTAGTAAVAAWTRCGGQDSARAGSAVATAGDVNGDGCADVLVGAPGHDFGATDNGAARLYLGSRSGLNVTPEWTGYGSSALSQSRTAFGAAVATAGDVDGDGFSDLVIGAPGFDLCDPPDDCAAVPRAGAAYVYLGAACIPQRTARWSVESDQAGARLGASVASARDVNGDGFSDVIVGAPLFDAGLINEGAAFVYLGSDTGLAATPAWSATGGQAQARFGASVAGAGDVNGDGFGDVIVGAPEYSGAQTREGQARVYLGSAAGVAAAPAVILVRGVANARFGFSVARAGDVNGDGLSDVVVGAPRHPGTLPDAGRAYLFLGGPGGPDTAAAWTGASPQDSSQFGYQVAGAGDVNGDNLDDVIVGAPFHDPSPALRDAGRAYVFLGAPSGDLGAAAAWTRSGVQAGERFGVAVGAAGDVDGDGFGDVIVGADGWSNPQSEEGRALVYHGSAAGPVATPARTWESNVAGARFGAAVATAGDLNLDGYSDVIVGAPGAGSRGAGAAVYSGSGAGLSASPAWSRSGPDASGFGAAVASAGDVDGDGFADLLVGAPTTSAGQNEEGRAHLYHGNCGPGVPRVPRLLQPDSTTAIDPPGVSTSSECVYMSVQLRLPGGSEWSEGLFPWDPAPKPSDSVCTNRQNCNPPSSGTKVPSDGAVAERNAGRLVCELEPGTAYLYRMRLATDSPLFPRTPWFASPHASPTAATFRTRAAPSAAAGRVAGGARPALEPAFPNPFAGRTTLAYTLPRAGPARLVVLDLQGRRTATLVDAFRPAGRHVVEWDGRGRDGRPAPPGVYFALLTAEGERRTRRLLLLR